jgi:hypothetical protein
MELKIEVAELQKRSLFIATPMYGGVCTGAFARSMQDLTALCLRYGIQMRCYYLFNESLITRARNYACDEFMRSGMTHMMFIDADIGFDPNDVISLLALQSDDSDYDIIGGPYPKKCIAWEKIKQAVDKGFADQDPNALDQFVGDYVFSPVMKEGVTNIRLDEPAEVLELGTGFMMIRRETFVKFQEAYPGQYYRPDHARTAHFDGSREIVAFFDAVIDPDSKRYLSEDYMFCQWSRKIGLKTYLCPWMRLSHTGTYTFGGSLHAIASIGAAATVDPTKIVKKQ